MLISIKLRLATAITLVVTAITLPAPVQSERTAPSLATVNAITAIQSGKITTPQFPDRTKEAETARLEAVRRAKEAQDAIAAQQRAYAAPVYSPQAVAVSGTCSSWLQAAGVTDTYNAMILINRESGCNPNAVNPSSGACGIGQQLPCGKWAHQWNDPVGSIIDMQNYVFQRYGSWANAVQWHYSHNWY